MGLFLYLRLVEIMTTKIEEIQEEINKLKKDSKIASPDEVLKIITFFESKTDVLNQNNYYELFSDFLHLLSSIHYSLEVNDLEKYKNIFSTDNLYKLESIFEKSPWFNDIIKRDILEKVFKVTAENQLHKNTEYNTKNR